MKLQPLLSIYEKNGVRFACPTALCRRYWQEGKLRHSRLEEEAGHKLFRSFEKIIITYGYISLDAYKDAL
jgi:hypothetical protein